MTGSELPSSSNNHNLISRFFQAAGKKRPRVPTCTDKDVNNNNHYKETPHHHDLTVGGTADDPLDVLDDSSDEEAFEKPSSSANVHVHEEASETPEQPSNKSNNNDNDELDIGDLPDPDNDRPNMIMSTTNGECSVLPNNVSQRASDPDANGSSETAAVPSQKENPFSCFAFSASNNPPPAQTTTGQPLHQWRISNQSNNPAHTATESSSKFKKAKTQKKKKEELVRLKDIAPEEQERIIKKWHSMADPNASLEVRRFQVLVATRLHARCQEPSVRKAMKCLREAFLNDLSVEQVAKADPEVLAHCINNLQFYNVKAKHIVKAANEIQTLFGGVVPEDELSLLKIMGVGKCFADLLAFVNTRAAHIEQTEADPTPCSKIDSPVSETNHL